MALALGGLLVALMAQPGTGDEDKIKKRNYEVERAQVKVMVDGMDSDKAEAALKSTLKSKFKRQAVTGWGSSSIVLKVNWGQKVKLSDLQYQLKLIGRRHKIKPEILVGEAELLGKVELRIKTSKKADADAIKAIVEKVGAIKGVVIPRPPTRTLSTLTLMVGDPGCIVDDVAKPIREVLELEAEEQPIDNVTWHGPRGKDPRRRPVRQGGGGSRH